MKAQVLSIGSELVLGHLTDTNATFLAQEVCDPRDRADLRHPGRRRPRSPVAALRTPGRHRPGDLHRRCRADRRRPDSRSDCRPRSAKSRDRSRPACRRSSPSSPPADLPCRRRMPSKPGSSRRPKPLANPIGTAPGWFVRAGQTAIVAMPGVPREMFRMWREQARPRIAATYRPNRSATTTLKTLGIGESAAEELPISSVPPIRLSRPTPRMTAFTFASPPSPPRWMRPIGCGWRRPPRSNGASPGTSMAPTMIRCRGRFSASSANRT